MILYRVCLTVWLVAIAAFYSLAWTDFGFHKGVSGFFLSLMHVGSFLAVAVLIWRSPASAFAAFRRKATSVARDRAAESLAG
jgi:hypothetical protein